MRTLVPSLWLGVTLIVASAAGCFIVPEPPGADANDGGANGDRDPNRDPRSGEETGCEGNGIPAAVNTVLAGCHGCHGDPPASPMALLTYEDLIADAKSDDTRSVAELVLERITSTSAPMPPSGAKVGDDAIDAFRAWLAAGTPREAGACPPDSGIKPDSPGTNNGANSELVCTSGETWNPGNQRKHGDDDDDDGWKGPRMNPGRACISCHVESGEGAIVQVGGTVYPTLHEPDLCFGMGREVGAKVVITDADGQIVELPVGDTGNFSLPRRGGSPRLRFPIRAKVVSSAGEREMNSPQNSGDCNSCHTEQGKNGAPGRILLP